jgi:hypothetical protein
MATELNYICPKNCKNTPDSIFNTLLAFSQNTPLICKKCKNELIIKLIFHFGLGVGEYPCRILDAFTVTNPSHWKNEVGNETYFYPFLVVLELENNKTKYTWLPYWHIEQDSEGKRLATKYGQWAPFLEHSILMDLLLQAKNKGHDLTCFSKP